MHAFLLSVRVSLSPTALTHGVRTVSGNVPLTPREARHMAELKELMAYSPGLTAHSRVLLSTVIKRLNAAAPSHKVPAQPRKSLSDAVRDAKITELQAGHTTMQMQDARITELEARHTTMQSELRYEIGSLRGATLPLSAAIALKAGVTTLGVANLLALAHKNRNAHSGFITLFQALGVIPPLNIKKHGTFTGATGLEALHVASLLLAAPQQLGQPSPHRASMYNQMTKLLASSGFGAKGARVWAAFLMIEKGGQIRAERNTFAHEMTVQTFLEIVTNLTKAAVAAKQPLSAPWQELMGLWSTLVGIPAVDSSSQLSAAELSIVLYNSACSL
ncbi:hypothetical protein DFH09DRAFT_1358458 [Mycena vulgaris]|nr:hypothetical protein DFH09DRAFT_1358458 [Mycena vulgaris]